nr:putative ribonuclease H-like domain-containing protein [Tanacetum cinerariifolium]
FNHKVKAIRCDNDIEFKNANLIEFYGSKGIQRDYSNARTLQQNGVAERKNRTLIEDARTMLADSLLPTIFWSEAVATACYVLNRVLVTKPHYKTPYELLTGDKPFISYLKPFSCHVTILNTNDPLGKFDKKYDEATTQNDGTKSDHATNNADNLDELTELQALQRQEQTGKEEADQLRLAFPSLNLILGVDIHDGLKIFDCPNFGIFTSSSYDEDFSGPDEHNLENSLNALADSDWVEAM